MIRFGVSLEEKLLKKFDGISRQKKYQNRSEAIRDLIRDMLVKSEWANPRGEVTGVISLVYDHHKRELVNNLTKIQHHHSGIAIIASQHVHLNHRNCLEVIVVKGDAVNVTGFAAKVRATKGIKHGGLVMTTTGGGIE